MKLNNNSDVFFNRHEEMDFYVTDTLTKSLMNQLLNIYSRKSSCIFLTYLLTVKPGSDHNLDGEVMDKLTRIGHLTSDTYLPNI